MKRDVTFRIVAAAGLVAAGFLLSSPPARAQTPPAAVGHWEGVFDAPNREIGFGLDVGRNEAGAIIATINLPESGIKGLPVVKLSVSGNTIGFDMPTDTGGRFEGTVDADGQTLTGDFAAQFGTLPFSMVRKGDARIAPVPRNAAIATELDGTWNGMLDVDGRQLRLLLKIAHQADGAALASIVSVDEGGMELPVAMTQSDGRVTIDLQAVGATYTGTLGHGNAELAGAFEQRGMQIPLTFKR
jgi:hypothetical protein